MILIPRYGYKVAAITSLASEACSVLLMLVVARTRVGFQPSVRYAPVLGLACGVMILLIVALPGPRLVAVAVGGIAYVGVLAVLPGTARWMLRNLVASARAARLDDRG